MRIKEAISDVIGACRYKARTFDIVDDERFSIGADALQDLGVEATVLLSAVVPVIRLEWQVIVEEVVTRDELSTVPLGNVATL